MKYVTIGDLHFGRKNNDPTWLASQRRFFDVTLLPYLRANIERDDAIVFVGDVFESRSSINAFVASYVQSLFDEIDELCVERDAHAFVIAGNHDYYSPIDTSERINNIDILLNARYERVVVVDKEIVTYRDTLFVAWYDFVNSSHTTLYRRARRVFTHGFEDTMNIMWQHDTDLWCGHVHQAFELGRHVHCIGSAYALDFADANIEKSIVVIDDETNNVTKIANRDSLRFFRVTFRDEMNVDDVINKICSTLRDDDYIELYVPRHMLSTTMFAQIERVSQCVAFSHFKMIRTNDDAIDKIACDDDANDTRVDTSIDFNATIRGMIPERLHELFNKIQKIYDENQKNSNQ